MSRGKTTSTSNQSYNQTTSLTPWSQGQFDNQFGTVKGLLDNRQATPYDGQFVAGLSDREQQARGMFEQNMGSFNPQFDESADMIRNAGLHADFGNVADQYMNPYQANVIDALRSQSTDALNENLAAAKERSLRNRAYGGSGHAVSEGIAQGEANKALNNQIAGLLYQGYNDARGFYGQDIGAQERRGGMLAELAAGRHQLNTNDIFGLNSLGEVERGIEQDRLGMEYNDYLRRDEDEWRKIQAQMGLLGSIPMLTNTSGTSSGTNTQTSNPGLLGTIGGIANIAGAAFGEGGAFPQIGGLMSNMMRTSVPSGLPNELVPRNW